MFLSGQGLEHVSDVAAHVQYTGKTLPTAEDLTKWVRSARTLHRSELEAALQGFSASRGPEVNAVTSLSVWTTLLIYGNKWWGKPLLMVQFLWLKLRSVFPAIPRSTLELTRSGNMSFYAICRRDRWFNRLVVAGVVVLAGVVLKMVL